MSGPRLSIIPARFVEDTRAELNHFKVINALGRHLDNDGWCKVKQSTLADAIGIRRETVCRCIKDLVDWGYVGKDEDASSGRALWYRVLLDSPSRPSRMEPAKAEVCVKPTCDPQRTGSTCDPERTAGVIATVTAGVTTPVTPGVTTLITHNDPSERSFLTLSPKAPAVPADGKVSERGFADVDISGDNLGTSGGAAGESLGAASATPRVASEPASETVDATPPDSIEQRVVAWLRQQGRHLRTIEHLIAPVLAERSLDRTASDPFQAFARVAKAYNDLPVPVLEAAVAAVLTERDAKVGTAQFDKAARAAKTRYDLTKMAASRDQRVASAMTADLVTLVAGTPAFAAYVAANPDAAGRPLVKLKPAEAELWASRAGRAPACLGQVGAADADAGQLRAPAAQAVEVAS